MTGDRAFPDGNRTRYLTAKRVLDIIGAATAIALLSPLMLIVATAVATFLGRPVLFRQARPGLHGLPFTLFKFRTMTEEVDADGVLLPPERRHTRFGRFLRRTSLDELPELWNVLKGDMSLVGPRPLLIKHLPLYTPEQARRHDVLPGLTGWAQVNGRNALDWDQKCRLDVWYVDHASLRLDLRILAMTVGIVLSGRGVDRPDLEAAGPAPNDDDDGDRTPP